MTGEPFSRPFRVAALPGAGLTETVEANPEERAGVARLLRIPAVTRLRGTFLLRPGGEGGASVRGRIAAAIVQTCVVTLDPVEQEIDEAVELRFSPQTERGKAQDAGFDDPAEDPPDPLVGGIVDLGAIAVEHLALGLDANPRKPGAVFDAEAAGVGIPRNSSLAGLAGWKARGAEGS